ncbi:MAG: hypothetical protein JOY79_09520, partial [Acidobacteriaceae bacterium]|nr:hypothetical protein [Acidobacteriaceae bacterium]
MFYASGDRIVASPLTGIAPAKGPIRYLDPFVTSVDGVEYERGVDVFLQTVIERYSSDEDRAALVPLFEQLHVERTDPDLAAWRRLEALLGFDPDEAPVELLEQLGRYERELGVASVEEASAAAPGIDAAAVLKTALDANKESSVKIDVTAVRELTSSGVRPSSRRLPWEVAEDAARELRQRLGMPHGPIRAQAFSQVLGVRWPDVIDAVATAARLPYGTTMESTHNRRRCALRSARGRSAQRRFELARALGDAVWDSGATFVPLGRARTDR